MNTYRYRFFAKCPNDMASIIYSLQIETGDIIMTEAIVAACVFGGPVYHEDVADQLFEKFGGKQTISATHGGVDVITLRAFGL